VLGAVASLRLGLRLPALPGPSEWIIDPEPDPDAESFPRAAAATSATSATELAATAAPTPVEASGRPS
jgi:hypothetical protein